MPRSLPRAVALPVLLVALFGACAALSACNRRSDTEQTLENARRELQVVGTKLAALPARCAVGDAAGAPGQWIESRNAAGAPGSAYTYVFTFESPVRSRAFGVALSASALQNLEKVETRDAAGTWTEASTGAPAGAPTDCEFVKVAQRFATGERDVAALRITIRRVRDSVTVADARLQKAG
jgi:hypothetical protein